MTLEVIKEASTASTVAICASSALLRSADVAVRMIVSVPFPPITVSVPTKPEMMSLPIPPVILSLPDPPVIESLPEPPVMVSLPTPPVIENPSLMVVWVVNVMRMPELLEASIASTLTN